MKWKICGYIYKLIQNKNWRYFWLLNELSPQLETKTDYNGDTTIYELPWITNMMINKNTETDNSDDTESIEDTVEVESET